MDIQGPQATTILMELKKASGNNEEVSAELHKIKKSMILGGWCGVDELFRGIVEAADRLSKSATPAVVAASKDMLDTAMDLWHQEHASQMDAVRAAWVEKGREDPKTKVPSTFSEDEWKDSKDLGSIVAPTAEEYAASLLRFVDGEDPSAFQSLPTCVYAPLCERLKGLASQSADQSAVAATSMLKKKG
jgi:hypothetical protein